MATDGTDTTPGNVDDQMHDWMDLALAEATTAGDRGEVPIGAVVVVDGKVVARRHNERETTGDPTAHAEILALRETTRSWKLTLALPLLASPQILILALILNQNPPF